MATNLNIIHIKELERYYKIPSFPIMIVCSTLFHSNYHYYRMDGSFVCDWRDRQIGEYAVIIFNGVFASSVFEYIRISEQTDNKLPYVQFGWSIKP